MARKSREPTPQAKPFDSVMKQMVEARPSDWVAFLGLPPGRTEMISADLATISSEADRVAYVDAAPAPYLLHIEFQAGHDSAQIPERLLRYNVLLAYRHGLPVQSVVFLLNKGSDSPRVTGTLEMQLPGAHVAYLSFAYRAVRVHELPVEAFLTGGLWTLPLALIANVSASELPDVVRKMERRIESEAPEVARLLWASTFITMGLKFPAEVAADLLKGVSKMKESTTYQAILAEGRAEGVAEGKAEGKAEGERAVVLRIGTKRFGTPSAEVQAVLNGITSLERLEALTDRLLEAESWDELLR